MPRILWTYAYRLSLRDIQLPTFPALMKQYVSWKANSRPPDKEIPSFYACRRLITMLIRPHISIQFCASTIHSTLPRPVFIQFIRHSILSSSPRFPTWPLLFSVFGIKLCKNFRSLPSVLSSLDISITTLPTHSRSIEAHAKHLSQQRIK